MERATKVVVTPGYNSPNDATMELKERTQRGNGLDFEDVVVASYTLRYLPDTNEVVLLKGDLARFELQEAVYSELLS